jgi:hypothetical protein
MHEFFSRVAKKFSAIALSLQSLTLIMQRFAAL